MPFVAERGGGAGVLLLLMCLVLRFGRSEPVLSLVFAFAVMKTYGIVPFCVFRPPHVYVRRMQKKHVHV